MLEYLEYILLQLFVPRPILHSEEQICLLEFASILAVNTVHTHKGSMYRYFVEILYTVVF